MAYICDKYDFGSFIEFMEEDLSFELNVTEKDTRYGSVQSFTCDIAVEDEENFIDRMYDLCLKAERIDDDADEETGEVTRVMYYVTNDSWDEWVKCADCGDWVNESDTYYVRDYGRVCEGCIDNFYRCPDCGEYVTESDWDFDAECCCSCAPEEDYDSRIHDYHDDYKRPELAFYDTVGALSEMGPGMYYFGAELEIDNGNDATNLLDDLDRIINPEEMFYEHDCSLNSGFEMITQPHTAAAFREMPWSEILGACRRWGYESHDAGTCGLHIHISRECFGANEVEQDRNIAKLIYFYDRWFADVQKFSRRNRDQVCSWANKYNVDTIGEAENAVREGRYAGRYHAVNITNTSTVEIRIMRGTLNYDTFMASFDFVQKTAEAASRIDISEIDDLAKWIGNCDTATFAYMRKRNCFTDYVGDPDGKEMTEASDYAA